MIRISPAAPTLLWMKVTLRDTTAAEREAAILPFIPDHEEVGLSVARSVGVNLVIITVPEGESIDSGNGPQLTVQLSPKGRSTAQLVDELLALSDLAQAHGRRVLWAQVR